MTEYKYRHEYKYLVSTEQITILQNRLPVIMQLDPHVNSEGKYKGFYNIRSAYFDDIDNSAYYDIQAGTDPRQKFRIRIYNHSDERISLELKQKRAGKCLKHSCPLSRSQCDALINDETLPFDESYPSLLQQLLMQIETRMLHPVVIVEYERIPYIFPIGNVRVTLDLNTRSSSQCERFFDDELLYRPVLQTGQHVFEVKWDEVLPDFIYQALSLDNLRQSSFSKYYNARKYSINNIQ